MFGMRSCLHLDIIGKLAHYVQKVADACNIRRHYESLHKKKYHVYKGKMRQEKMSELKSSLVKQKSYFTDINKASEASVKASFAISEMIAKSSPFCRRKVY